MGPEKDMAADYNHSYKSDPDYQAQRRFTIAKRIAFVTLIIAVTFLAVSMIGRMVFFNSDYVSHVGGVSGPVNVETTKEIISPLRWLNAVGKIMPVTLVIFVLSATYCIVAKIKR
jgi:hypothetical protein